MVKNPGYYGEAAEKFFLGLLNMLKRNSYGTYTSNQEMQFYRYGKMRISGVTGGKARALRAIAHPGCMIKKALKNEIKRQARIFGAF